MMVAHPRAGVRSVRYSGHIGRPSVAAVAESIGRLSGLTLCNYLVHAHKVHTYLAQAYVTQAYVVHAHVQYKELMQTRGRSFEKSLTCMRSSCHNPS